MPRLLVAVWQQNTKQITNPNLRLKQLGDALEIAWNMMRKNIGVEKTDVRYLFVAPEYLFTAQNGHFMDEQMQGIVRAELVFLSLKFPELLLIPGSIGFYKTSQRSPIDQLRKTWKGKVGGPRDMNKYVDRYRNNPSKPDYSFTPDYLKGKYYDTPYEELSQMKNDTLGTPQKPAMKTSQQLLAESNPTIKIARNRTLVLRSAMVIHKYDKQFEAWDSDDRDINKEDIGTPILFLPGNHTPVFTDRGISYGIELCADHNSAALKLYTNKIASQNIDIHLLLSASTETEDLHMVGAKYFIQSDAENTLVLKNSEEIKPIEREDTIRIYDLDW